MKRILLLSTAMIGAVALDLSAKALAERALVWHVPREVLGEWFRLTLTYNEGIAFGLFATDGPGVIIVSGLTTLLLAVWLVHALRTGHYPLPAPWALGLLLGGAVANLADRFADGRVTDFLDLGVGAHRFATFNLADIFILTGVALLLLASVRVPRAPEPSPQPTGERGEAAV